MRQLGQIRTPIEEFLVQEGTPEQQEWAAIINQHRRYERYAQSCARMFLTMVERISASQGPRIAREVCKDRKFVYETMRDGYCVEVNHLDYACELVAKCGERRFP